MLEKHELILCTDSEVEIDAEKVIRPILVVPDVGYVAARLDLGDAARSVSLVMTRDSGAEARAIEEPVTESSIRREYVAFARARMGSQRSVVLELIRNEIRMQMTPELQTLQGLKSAVATIQAFEYSKFLTLPRGCEAEWIGDRMLTHECAAPALPPSLH